MSRQRAGLSVRMESLFQELQTQNFDPESVVLAQDLPSESDKLCIFRMNFESLREVLEAACDKSLESEILGSFQNLML